MGLNVGYRVHGAPQDPALTFVLADGSCRSHTYADVERMTGVFQSRLAVLGLAAGDAVGVLAENSDDTIFLWLAALRAGLTVVPVNHKLPAAAVAHILMDASVRHVLVDEGRRHLVPEGMPSSPLESGPEVPAAVPDGIRDIDPEATCVVLYTSGSTGMPKGVAMSHAGYNWTIDMRLRGGPHSSHCLIAAAPLYHINALGAVTFALAAGAHAVLLQRFDARLYIDSIARFRCTWLTSVPAMIAMVVRESELLARTDLSSVRIVRMGSSPVSDKLLAQVRQVFGNVNLSNHYGTTEGGPLVFGAGPGGKVTPDGGAGWPLPGVDVRLVDEQGRVAADQGVLVHKTPATMKGYLNLPEKTRAVLSDDGWYFSGDIFRRDEDGCYWFVSRSDDMFVCGGENIHPQEAERVLEMHPGVQQACVVPVPDEVKGAKPVAFVVIRPGAAVTEDELKSHALAHGPAYQHPRRIHFVDSLPLAGTNKIDRKLLIGLAQESP
ncbi:MAG: acyl--CoA ligase [Rhodoferax sp.]|jgi:long-chain acyl-CoA synthetase|nr:acyl--CoA ligase [Rhodoferax sp.]